MSKLKEIEHDLVRELMSIGLGKAADSLATLTKDKVLLEWFDLHLFSADSANKLPLKFTETVTILTTYVIGDLPGVSFLIFNGKDSDEVAKNTLGEEILNSVSAADAIELKSAVLLELDNIVAASVITQFSNLLDTKIHGGVPNVNQIAPENANSFMLEKASEFSIMLMAKVNFKAYKKKLSPKFVWFFGNEFIERIKLRAENIKQPILLKNW